MSDANHRSTTPVSGCLAVGYARQSTDEENKQRHSIPAQRRAIQAEAKRLNLELAEIVEERTSGWKERKAAHAGGIIGYDLGAVQPQLDGLLSRLASADPPPVLICHRVDRICRHIPTLRSIRDGSAQRGHVLWEVDNQVDMADAANAAKFEALADEAEAFSRAVSKNVARRNADSRRRGKFVGQIPPFGYRYVKQDDAEDGEGHLAPDKETSKWYKAAVQWALRGDSARTMAERITAKGYPLTAEGLTRILKSSVYIGMAVTRRNGQEEWYKADHEALIDHETWTDLQAEMARRQEIRPLRTKHTDSDEDAERHTFPWSGILRCPPPCEHRWCGDNAPSGPRYVCYSTYHRQLPVDAKTRRRCRVKGPVTVREVALDDALFHYLSRHTLNAEAAQSLVQQMTQRAARLAADATKLAENDAERAEVEAKIERVLSLVENGEQDFTAERARKRIEALRADQGKLELERERLLRRTSDYRGEADLPSAEQIADLFGWIQLAHPLLTRRERAALLRALFVEVRFGEPKAVGPRGQSVPYLKTWTHRVPVIGEALEGWRPYAEEAAERLAQVNKEQGVDDTEILERFDLAYRWLEVVAWGEATGQFTMPDGFVEYAAARGFPIPHWWTDQHRAELQQLAAKTQERALAVTRAFLASASAGSVENPTTASSSSPTSATWRRCAISRCRSARRWAGT